MRKLTSILILLKILILFGCRKTDSLIKHPDPVIESAKVWLLNKINNSNEIISQTNNPGIKKLSNKFDVKWKDAIVHDFDDHIVIEVPAKFEKEIILEDGPTINKNGNKNGVFRLIVVKSKTSGLFNGYIMALKADNINYSQDYKNLELNNYKVKQNSFNGTVSFYNLDWTFVNGWKFHNGIVSGEISGISYVDKQAIPENEILGLVAPEEGSGCTTKTTNWYVQICYYFEDGSPAGCTDWEYMYSTTTTVCSGTGGSGGVGYVTTGENVDFINSPEFQAFQRDYRKEMSAAEIYIFDKMSTYHQLEYLSNAYYARETSKKYFPTNQENGGIGDAFRHALFNALNVKSLGLTLAKSLGDAKEDYATNDPGHKRIDLLNNEIGRNLYQWAIQNGYYNPHATRYEWAHEEGRYKYHIEQRLYSMANSGQLYTNTPPVMVE